MDLLNCVCKIDGTWLKSSYYYTICKMLGILRHYTYIASRITFKRLTFSIYKGRTFSFLIVGPLLDRNLVVRSRRESERRKEANIPWVTQPAFSLQGISEREREREREKDKGTQALMEQRCFIEFCKSTSSFFR